MTNITYFYNEIFLTILALLAILTGIFVKSSVSNHRVKYLCAGSLYLLFIINSIVFSNADLSTDRYIVNQLFIVNSATNVIKTILILVVAIVASITNSKFYSFEFFILLVFSLIGLCLMVSANDLMALYVGLELATFSAYILASFHISSARSSEAGLKYFLLGSLASAIYLFGVSIIYGISGSTLYANVNLFLIIEGFDNILAIIAMVFILSGLAFKVSAAPFHMWTPDVFEGAPISANLFFATAMKFASLIVFFTIIYKVFRAESVNWQSIVSVIAIASMLVGSFGALLQTNLKRLLAYSSISHVGFALLALIPDNSTAIYSFFFYSIIYLVMSLGAFLLIHLMVRDGYYFEDIKELGGLNKNHKGLALIILVFMFSLAGVPPFAGFFAKFQIFLAILENESNLYLALIAALSSVVSAFYYLRIVKIIYFDPQMDTIDNTNPVIYVTLTITALLIAGALLYLGSLSTLINNNLVDFYLYKFITTLQ